MEQLLGNFSIYNRGGILLAKKESNNNIYVYKKRTNINIGVILFGVILVYLIVTILAYLTANHVTVYEVREGSILKDNSYAGIAIREETVVKSDGTGYINFFATEGSKVGKLTNIYSISNEALDFTETDKENEESYALTSEEQNAVVLKTQTFVDNYRDDYYEDTYQYKENVEKIISNNVSLGKTYKGIISDDFLNSLSFNENDRIEKSITSVEEQLVEEKPETITEPPIKEKIENVLNRRFFINRPYCGCARCKHYCNFYK